MGSEQKIKRVEPVGKKKRQRPAQHEDNKVKAAMDI